MSSESPTPEPENLSLSSELLFRKGEKLFREARRISEKYENAGALVSPLEDEPSEGGSPEAEQSKVIENQADTEDSSPA